MPSSIAALHRWPLLLAVLAIVAACSSAPTATSETTPASSRPTGALATPAVTSLTTEAFEVVMDMMGPEGEVSVDMALQAFALAIAPLPGVTPPTGPNTRPDADIALGLVLKVWDSLSPAQLTAVESALEAFPNPYVRAAQADAGQAHTAAALAVFNPAMALAERDCGLVVGDPVDPPTGSTAVQRYVDMVRDAATALTTHLGRPPGQNLAVCLVSEADPWRTGGVTFDANGGTVGVPDSCVVYVNLQNLASLEADGDLGIALAYSTFLCFAATVGRGGETVAAFYGRIPPWVIYGTATWAAASIAAEVFGSPGGVGLSKVWVRYLTDPSKTLFSRDKDAIGFMAQVDQDKPSAWDVVNDMLFHTNPQDAFAVATKARTSFDDLWAAGYFRDASRGPDWDIVGPGIPTDTAEAGSLEIANGARLEMAAPPWAVAIADLSTSADVTVIVGGSRLRVHDGVQDLKVVQNQAYCTKAGGANACVCPPGSPGALRPPPPPLNTEAKLALTGSYYGGTASITGISLKDYCGTAASPAPSEGLLPLPDPCALITQAEAAEAASHAVEPGFQVPATVDELGSGLGCPFRTPNPRGPAIAADVRIDALDLSGSAAGTFAAVKHGVLSGGMGGEVAGLGDDSFYLGAPTGPVNLFVRKRNIVLLVAVVTANGLEQATQLARLALGRF